MSLRDTIRRSVWPGPPTDGTDSSDTRRGRLLRSAASLERELWLGVVCVMLIDITLTVHGLNLGLVELNPLARHALERIDVFGLYGLKLVALGLGVCCRFAIHDRYAPVVPLGLAIPSLVAVCINTVVIASIVF